jgi:hypothetical protein
VQNSRAPVAEARFLNKTMDRADLELPEARRVVSELDALIRRLRSEGLPVSSWYGKLDIAGDRFQLANRGFDYEPLPGAAEDLSWPWFLYWEIAWLVINNAYEPGDRLLDLGGGASLFSYYMASKGLEVMTMDVQRELVEAANEVSRRTGWQLVNHLTDMRELSFDRPFDHATSVCVFEHIPVSGRIEVSARVRDVLREGGTFSITFDYCNPSRRARICSPRSVEEQFIEPSGLRVRGNREFHDNGKRYLAHPFFRAGAWRRGWKPLLLLRREFGFREAFETRRENDYTFGALFMQR